LNKFKQRTQTLINIKYACPEIYHKNTINIKYTNPALPASGQPASWGAKVVVHQSDYARFDASTFAGWVKRSVAVASVFGREGADRLQEMIVDFYLGGSRQQQQEADDGKEEDFRFYLAQFV
jgi:hypothetical protein